MIRPIVLVLLAGLLAPAVLSAAAAQPAAFLVELAPGADASAVASRSGAVLESQVGQAAVYLASPAAAGRLARDTAVVSVQEDGRVRATASGWDGASWDGASWDGASWDGASWDGASWDGASWDGASWDGASWDGASWDASGWDGASWDGASWDGASWDGASWDGASWDGASWDGASWDGNGSPGPLAPWGLFAIHAPDAWRLAQSDDARLVCMVDSGMDVAHPALASRFAGGYDAITGGSDVSDPAGHGTHLAGIVAATRDQPWTGVSEARIAVAKAIGPDGFGQTSDVIASIAWCDARDADIILLALTEDAPTRAFAAAVASAQRNGALVVASAGNAGPCERCVASPASLPGVLAAGAFMPNGAVAPFSASGAHVDVLAPGVLIASTAPGGGFRAASGTSQAAAFVAGAAALAWSECPGMSQAQLAKALAPPGRGTPRLDLMNDRLVTCYGA